MLYQLFHRLFRRRHYWRQVSFDEIAELYASRLLTIFAINVVNLFAAIYLYKLGYSVVDIALFYAFWYVFKVPFSVVAAKYASYFGPKHGILLANILRVPSLIAFAFVPQYGLPAMMVFGAFQQMSSTLYDLCYLIDFSKVKNTIHAGKEIGMMQIIEKVAKVVSPLVGGAIASLYSPQATILVACGLFIVAAFPLFRTVEPTLTRAKMRLRGFPWRLAIPTLISETVVGFDFIASGITWTLFAGIFIFGSTGSGVYAALGALASLGVFVSILAAWIFGQIVDRHKGRILFTVGALTNSMIHIFRPFVSTPAGMIGANIANETATSAYSMPFTRVLFDVADTSGFRITYMMFIEMMVNAGAALGCLLFALLVYLMGEKPGMQTLFGVAAVYELLLLVSRRYVR